MRVLIQLPFLLRNIEACLDELNFLTELQWMQTNDLVVRRDITATQLHQSGMLNVFRPLTKKDSDALLLNLMLRYLLSIILLYLCCSLTIFS